jgi:hypothetical protein
MGTKDGRIRADADSEGQYSDDRKAWPATQLAKRVTEILEESGHLNFNSQPCQQTELAAQHDPRRTRG